MQNKKNHFFYKTNKILLVLLLLNFIGCGNKIDYYYCDTIECTSGEYIIKLSSPGFYKYIKDSTNYKIEYKKNNDTYSDRGLFIVDSIMNTKEYISKEEQKLLLRMTQNTENIKGKWGDEHCINYHFKFKNPQELTSFKIAFAKHQLAWQYSFVKPITEKQNKKTGAIDTLKNAELMKKILSNNVRYFIKKNDQIYFTKQAKRIDNINFIDTSYIFFPREVKKVEGIAYKLSNNRKKITVFDTIKSRPKNKHKSNILAIEFLD